MLEIGCGEGKRCLDVAARGAREVLGIDPFGKSIQAAERAPRERPELGDVVRYRQCTIHDLDEGDFDVVISENAFEHILDVPEVLVAIRERLHPGGRAYIGFGPLYHSPYGDHGWMRAAIPGGQRFPLPWGHLLVPQAWLFRRMERLYGKPVRSTRDWPFLALNRLTAADFRRFFRESGMRIVRGRGDANRSWKGKAFGLASRFPVLQKYCTLGLYYILEKPAVEAATDRGTGHRRRGEIEVHAFAESAA